MDVSIFIKLEFKIIIEIKIFIFGFSDYCQLFNFKVHCKFLIYFVL